MKKKITVFFTMLIVVLTTAQAQVVHNLNKEMAQTTLRVAAERTVPQEFLKEAKAARVFEINPVLKSAKSVKIGDYVDLQLFENQSYTAQIEKTATNVNGNFTIMLKFPDYPMAFGYITTNTENKSLVSVSIPELNRKYVSRSNIVSPVSFLIEVDENSAIKPESDGVEIPKGRPAIEEITAAAPMIDCSLNSSLTGTDPATISLMIVYTPAAAAWAATYEGGISNTIAGAMAQTAAVIANQGNGDAINLVHSAQINYTEFMGDAMITDLYRLANTSDGFMDEVHQLRKQYNADIVALFEANDEMGGRGFLLSNIINGNVDYAFNVVRVGQASWTTTSIHEIGHNLGMNHEVEQYGSNPPTPIYPYAWGWYWTGSDHVEYGSVMSYTGRETPYFSNPNVIHQGQPAGTSEANNAQTFRNTKHIVAFYSDRLNNLPVAPATVQVTNPTNNGATFSWSPSANAVSYWFCILAEGGGGYYPYSTTNTFFTIDWFEPCKTYEYFIMAFNECGNAVSSQRFTFSTACQNGDATLASLTVNQGTLMPAFNANTTNYTVSVANSVTSINISATANQATSTIVGTGTKTLNVGDNTFDIVVTAEDGTTKTYTVVVTRAQITTIAVTGISLDQTTLSLNTNATAQLTATVSPADATNKNVTWSSSNTGIATVSATGLVTAIAEGAATITVTTEDGNKTATCIVTILSRDATLSDLAVSTGTLSPAFSPDHINYSVSVENDIASITISAIASHSAATVNGTGTKTLTVGDNTFGIVVTAEDGTTKTYTLVITRAPITTVAVTGVLLNKTTLSLAAGAIEQLAATIQPGNATNQTVMWSSDNPSIATVSATGLVTAVAEGSAAITVTTEDGNKTATCEVNVTQSYTVTVSANPAAGGTVSGGGTYDSGTSCPVTATANSGYSFTNWTENNSEVSTNATYTFNVTSDRTLVANFTRNTLVVSPASYNFSVSGGTITINVRSNVSWAVSYDASWLTVSSTNGSNDETFVIEAGENTSTARSAAVTVTGGELMQTVSITQDASETGIKEVLAGQFAIYPNPAKEEIFIKSGLPVKKVEICDLSGRIMSITDYKLRIAEDSVQSVNISSLSKGVYLVKVHTDSEMVVKKIVKK